MKVPASIVAQEIVGKSFSWKIAAELPSQLPGKPALGLAGAVSGIHQQHLIIAGGANFPQQMPWEGGKKQYYADIYVYNIQNNQAKLIPTSVTLPNPLAYAATCSTPLGVLVAGGENESGIQSAAVLLQYNAQKQSIDITELPSLPIPLTNAAITSINHFVYIAGGETISGVSDKLFSCNLMDISAGWKTVSSLPHPVSHAVLLAANINQETHLFLCGGRMKTDAGISTLYKDVFECSTSNYHWNQLSSLPSYLSAGTGFFLAPNQLVLLGGDKGIIFHQTEKRIQEIQHAKTDTERAALVQQKNQLLVSHPGFSNEILIAQYPAMEWKVAGQIPFPAPVTTTIVKGEQGYWIASGEVKPGMRTPQILLLTIKHLHP